MKQLYYKGEGYDFEVREINGKRQYLLSKDGIVKHTVEQAELDIKSIVSLILDSYYRSTRPTVQSGQLA